DRGLVQVGEPVVVDDDPALGGGQLGPRLAEGVGALGGLAGAGVQLGDQVVDRASPVGLGVVPGVVDLQEDPLRPPVVVDVGGRDGPAGVVAQPQAAQLPPHVGDVRLGGHPRVLARLHRVLLGGQAEGVVAHRVQDVEAQHPLVAGVDVGADVAQRVSDVQPRTAGVGEHVQHVQLGPVGDPVEAGAQVPDRVGRVVRALPLPAVLPRRLDLLGELRRVAEGGRVGPRFAGGRRGLGHEGQGYRPLRAPHEVGSDAGGGTCARPPGRGCNPQGRPQVGPVMPSLLRRLQRAAERDTAVTFVVGDDEVVVPWRELHEQAKGYAAALQARGVRPGDHVALLSPTTRELVTAIQATWLAGATVVVLPLPMRLSSIEEFVAQTRQRIRHADAKLCLVDPELAAFVTPEPDDPPLVDIGEPAAGDPAAWQRPDDDPERLVILQFTSGSTSDPKGVMLPDRVVRANLDAIAEAAKLDVDDDVVVSWLPLYHDMGLVGILTLTMSTGTALVQGAPQDFTARPARWMEWISRYRATATAGPNFSYVLATRALKRAEGLDLSRLRI